MRPQPAALSLPSFPCAGSRVRGKIYSHSQCSNLSVRWLRAGASSPSWTEVSKWWNPMDFIALKKSGWLLTFICPLFLRPYSRIPWVRYATFLNHYLFVTYDKILVTFMKWMIHWDYILKNEINDTMQATIPVTGLDSGMTFCDGSHFSGWEDWMTQGTWHQEWVLSMKSHFIYIVTSNDWIHFHLLRSVLGPYLESNLSDPFRGVTSEICQHDKWSLLFLLLSVPAFWDSDNWENSCNFLFNHGKPQRWRNRPIVWKAIILF